MLPESDEHRVEAATSVCHAPGESGASSTRVSAWYRCLEDDARPVALSEAGVVDCEGLGYWLAHAGCNVGLKIDAVAGQGVERRVLVVAHHARAVRVFESLGKEVPGVGRTR